MKKTLVTLFVAVLAVIMCVPSMALTLDTAEAAAETTFVPADADLAAATSIVPGINVVNGKAAIETFDDDTVGERPTASGLSWDGWTTVGVSSTYSVSGSNSFAGTSGTTYPKLYFDMVAEAGRKYYIHMSAFADDKSYTGYCYWLMQDGSSSNHVFKSYDLNSTVQAGAWRTIDEVYTSATANRFYIQMQAPTQTVYYDDLAIVPYYKITYNTIDEKDYVLFADEAVRDLSKLATTYTVKTDNYPADQVINGVYSTCIGWATTAGATEPITSVSLANADVTLYPVWIEGDFITPEGTYMLGKKDTTFTITSVEPVEWTYDVHDTLATVATTETSLTITAAGFAGYVDVTAQSLEDETKFVATSVRMVGGDYYRPGYNIWTGTEDAYGFEDIDASVVNTSASPTERDKEIVSVGGMSISTKAKLDNPDNMAVYFSGNFPHFTMKKGVHPVIEADRPLYISYNKMGAKGTSLQIFRNKLNVASGALKVDGLPNYESDWVNYYCTVTPLSVAANNDGSPDEYKDTTQDVNNIVFMKASGDSDVWLDDVMVVPFYKITYCAADGTPVETDYALADDTGRFLDYYIPDNSLVEGATGFSLEFDGEKVTKVPLNHEDITLYAIMSNNVTYVNGDTIVESDFEGDIYTFPTPDDVFEGGVANFKAWYVDGVNYRPGDEVDPEVVIGNYVEAVSFSAKLFDPQKGILVAYANFEQLGAVEDTFAYINRAYTQSVTGLSAIDGMSGRAVHPVDGGHALRINSAGGQYCFGFYNATVERSGKYNFSFKAKAIEPLYTGTDSVPLSSRFNGGFIRFNPGSKDNGFGHHLSKNWQTISSSNTQTSYTGTGINVYQKSYTSDGGTADDTTDDVKRYYKTHWYLDDVALYCYPENLLVFKPSAIADEYFEVTADDITGNYTFPTPEDIGMNSPFFVSWTDGTNFYEAGDVVSFADIQYKYFYAYVQDPTTPAMGFSFEGTTAPNVVKKTYTENIDDEGRDVLHIHQWGSTWNGNNVYHSDTRIHMYVEGFDATLYDIVEYAYKVENAAKVVNIKAPASMTEEDYEYVDETETKIYYITNNGSGNNFFGTGGEYLVGNGGFNVNADGKYHVNTIDMGVTSNGNATYPWVSVADAKIYGLCLDPNKTGTFAGDMYIDYLRVYKSGNTTVTYNTNAPDGATVVTEVAADTGRGLGTGYLLTGKRPEVEGYIFRGWALTPDATAADTVDAIDLAEDTTVYAVWESADAAKAPASTEEFSIRGNGEFNGLRFKATIKNSEMTSLEEFGFIATRETLLGSNALTFDFKKNGANEALYAVGVAYDKSEGINIMNSESDDGIIYTAVATGIPLEAKNENMVMRTYAKYTINGNAITVYGNNMSTSLYEVAKAIADENGESYANNKDYIDSIIAE